MILGIVLLTTACGSSKGDGNGGQPDRLYGTLLIDGSGKVQTLDPATGAWVERFGYTIGNALPAVDRLNDRFYMAHFTSGAASFHVEAYDLRTFALTGDRFEWPDTSMAERMKGLAFSPDGRYAAAVITTGTENELSVIDLEVDPPVELMREFRGSVGPDLVWLDSSQLAFSLDVSDQTADPVSDDEGAIVSLDIRVASGLELRKRVGFAGGPWRAPDSVTGLALSPDGNELAFSLEGTLLVQDLTAPDSEPHPLTSGPHPHVGPAFSPDGNDVAFVEAHPWRQASVFSVSNHSGEAIRIDDAGAARNRHLIADGLAYRVLAWLP